jgi:SAM-dependent methyltransferase
MTPAQDHFWSRAAEDYEAEFIDPYRADVTNPLLERLRELPGTAGKTVADLGCGIGPLLPFLAQHFATVIGVDFAEGMLARARVRCREYANVALRQCPLTDLTALAGQIDVAVAVNSLIMADLRDLEKSLQQIHAVLRPGGVFLAILPAMDAVHYCTMLLLDRALAQGLPMNQARRNAGHHGEHSLYDFAFGEFRYHGLEQHFWQPFEIRHRLRRAGFRRLRMTKVLLSWQQFACGTDLQDHPPPWDWFVQAEPGASAPGESEVGEPGVFGKAPGEGKSSTRVGAFGAERAK